VSHFKAHPSVVHRHLFHLDNLDKTYVINLRNLKQLNRLCLPCLFSHFSLWSWIVLYAINVNNKIGLKAITKEHRKIARSSFFHYQTHKPFNSNIPEHVFPSCFFFLFCLPWDAACRLVSVGQSVQPPGVVSRPACRSPRPRRVRRRTPRIKRFYTVCKCCKCSMLAHCSYL